MLFNTFSKKIIAIAKKPVTFKEIKGALELILRCPVELEIPTDPISTDSLQTFNLKAFLKTPPNCPVTRQTIRFATLNNPLKKLTDALKNRKEFEEYLNSIDYYTDWVNSKQIRKLSDIASKNVYEFFQGKLFQRYYSSLESEYRTMVDELENLKPQIPETLKTRSYDKGLYKIKLKHRRQLGSVFAKKGDKLETIMIHQSIVSQTNGPYKIETNRYKIVTTVCGNKDGLPVLYFKVIDLSTNSVIQEKKESISDLKKKKMEESFKKATLRNIEPCIFSYHKDNSGLTSDYSKLPLLSNPGEYQFVTIKEESGNTTNNSHLLAFNYHGTMHYRYINTQAESDPKKAIDLCINATKEFFQSFEHHETNRTTHVRHRIETGHSVMTVQCIGNKHRVKF